MTIFENKLIQSILTAVAITPFAWLLFHGYWIIALVLIVVAVFAAFGLLVWVFAEANKAHYPPDDYEWF